MEKAAWKQYFEAFSSRMDAIPDDAFDRGSLLYEAAHDSYEDTTNRLTAAGVDEERALVLGRMFGAVVKQWVDRDGHDIEHLERDLKAQYELVFPEKNG
jgi:hypothetical protein